MFFGGLDRKQQRSMPNGLASWGLWESKNEVW